jgi:D-glycero-beta-D-manno-heptose 1-phosphate adenylyltransferase
MDKLEIINRKIIPQSALSSLKSVWKLQSQQIVFTNGCFDILHRGHVEYLAKAASLGNILVVGLNTDASVKRLKGPNRPINDEQSRAIVLSALQYINYVILFDEDTPYELIKKVEPDFLVKGSDYTPENIVGADIVQAKGGKVITIDLTEGFSTSKTIAEINKKTD